MKETTMNQTRQSRSPRPISATVLPAVAIGVAFGLAWANSARAASSATQDVDITVQSVNEISVGSTVTLTINSAVAGQSLTGSTTSTYAITTNSATSKKITAQLATPLDSGLTLSVFLQAPAGGTSAGSLAAPVALNSATASDVVTSIEAVAAPSLTINYAATAAVTVAPNTYSADVTYTITNDS
jgi:hypothetical protein